MRPSCRLLQLAHARRVKGKKGNSMVGVGPGDPQFESVKSLFEMQRLEALRPAASHRGEELVPWAEKPALKSWTGLQLDDLKDNTSDSSHAVLHRVGYEAQWHHFGDVEAHVVTAVYDMPKLQRDPEVYRFSLQWKFRKAYLQERKNILLVAQLPDRVNVWLWNRKHYADAGLNREKVVLHGTYSKDGQIAFFTELGQLLAALPMSVA